MKDFTLSKESQIDAVPPQESQEDISEKKIKALLIEVGLDPEKIAPRIMDRLILLNNLTETVNDEKNAIKIARSIFSYYDMQKPRESFTEDERRVVIVGSLFTDIGKTGPRNASLEQQQLISQMYGIENVANPQMSVAEFFELYFSDDASERIRRFREMGLDPEITMRAFWNLHSLWSLEIISGDGVPPEAIAGAVLHHFLEGVNPEDIVDKNGKFTKYFGDNAYFDRAEKLIILLDKFDAAVRRGKKTPKEAIAWLRKKVYDDPRFIGDVEFEVLLKDFDNLFVESELALV